MSPPNQPSSMLRTRMNGSSQSCLHIRMVKHQSRTKEARGHREARFKAYNASLPSTTYRKNTLSTSHDAGEAEIEHPFPDMVDGSCQLRLSLSQHCIQPDPISWMYPPQGRGAQPTQRRLRRQTYRRLDQPCIHCQFRAVRRRPRNRSLRYHSLERLGPSYPKQSPGLATRREHRLTIAEKMLLRQPRWRCAAFIHWVRLTRHWTLLVKPTRQEDEKPGDWICSFRHHHHGDRYHLNAYVGPGAHDCE
ncbi:hypothetical protein M011DRAFT_121956 [Sporormia fimetaria CBS 119925]|uniref:Uncharacterized protein n=1 Tax=Sporormia fimetaria CBS 119925 TaxID=1340428 RepID=A0A6A6V592_9PLEO|nr:hypothetical protein M011DRAFT_121956 [Sporormia fimetaria CBS 119925]